MSLTSHHLNAGSGTSLRPNQPHSQSPNGNVGFAATTLNEAGPPATPSVGLSNQASSLGDETALISSKKFRSISNHRGESQAELPRLDGRERQTSTPTTLAVPIKQHQVSDQNQILVQTRQTIQHVWSNGLSQDQMHLPSPTFPIAKAHTKVPTDAEGSGGRYQNDPGKAHGYSTAVRQTQPIIEQRRSTVTSNDARNSSHGRAPMNTQHQYRSQNQVQGGNKYPNLELPSWTTLDSHSTDTDTVSVSNPTFINPPSGAFPALHSNLSTDITNNSASFTKKTAASPAREISVRAESNGPSLGRTNAYSNPNVEPDASADVNTRDLDKRLNIRNNGRITWSPRGVDNVSEPGCLPQLQSHTPTQSQLPIQLEPRMTLSGSQKKRKRDSELGSSIEERNLSPQSHETSQPNVSPSTATALSVETDRIHAIKEATSIDADMNVNSKLTPLSDMSIDSDMVILNQPSGADDIQCQECALNAVGAVVSGTLFSSKARPSGDATEPTVNPEPIPAAAQSSGITSLPTSFQFTTTVPPNPRNDPAIAAKVGNILQSLVATTGMDSKFMLRLTKELYEAKKKLNKDNTENKNGPSLENVNHTRVDVNAHSLQKDGDIQRLVQEICELRRLSNSFIDENRKIRADNTQFHTMLSAKNNEIGILVNRNRELEVELGNVRSQRDDMTQKYSCLRNDFNNFVQSVRSGAHPRVNANLQNRPIMDSPVTSGAPATPMSQQAGVARASSHPSRRESLGTASTRSTPTQSPTPGMHALPGSASMASVPSLRVTPRVGAIQGHQRPAPKSAPAGYPAEQQVNVSSIPRLPALHTQTQVQVNTQIQRMEAAARQHHHYPLHANAPLALNQPPSTQQQLQHSQPASGSAAVQYQQQFRKQGIAQNQLITQFENAHMSRLPASTSGHAISSPSPISETQRRVGNVRQPYSYPSSVNGQVTRRHSDSVINQVSEVRGASASLGTVPYQGHICPTQVYPTQGDQRSPQVHLQSSARPTISPPVRYHLPPDTPLDSSQVPLSYTVDVTVLPNQSPAQSILRENQQSIVPVPPSTEMQQSLSLQSQTQSMTSQEGVQIAEVSSSSPLADPKRFVIDLTNDGDEEIERLPKKRSRMEGGEEIADHDVIPAPAGTTLPSNENIVDDVKVEGDNETMTIENGRLTESRVDAFGTSLSTITQPREELSSESSIADGIDASNPDVIEVVTSAFAGTHEADPSLRYCFFCSTRQEDDPQAWTNITILKNPTFEEMLNHVKEVHPLVLEAIHSGKQGEHEQGE